MAADTASVDLIDEWRQDVDALYAEIGNWVQEMGSPPHIERREITLHEQRSGPYRIDELILTHQGRHMEVRPKARWVLGADGRVDILWTEGPVILVLLRDQGGWFLVPDSRHDALRPLTGDVFRRIAASLQ